MIEDKLFELLEDITAQLNSEIPEEFSTSRFRQFQWACKEGNKRLSRILLSVYKVEIVNDTDNIKNVFKTSCKDANWDIAYWLVQALYLKENIIYETFKELCIENTYLGILEKFKEKFIHQETWIDKKEKTDGDFDPVYQFISMIPHLQMEVHKWLYNMYFSSVIDHRSIPSVCDRLNTKPYPDTKYLQWLFEAYGLNTDQIFSMVWIWDTFDMEVLFWVFETFKVTKKFLLSSKIMHYSPIRLASRRGKIEALELYLEKGEDQYEDSYEVAVGNTEFTLSLCDALEKDHLDIAKKIFEYVGESEIRSKTCPRALGKLMSNMIGSKVSVKTVKWALKNLYFDYDCLSGHQIVNYLYPNATMWAKKEGKWIKKNDF